MLSRRLSVASIVASLPLFVAAGAHAQDATTNQVRKDVTDIKSTDAPQQEGVFGSIRGDVTFSLTDTQKVVGQPDGTTINFGAKVEGHVDVIQKAHEWRNSLFINAGVTKSPVVPQLVKTTDALSFESIYLYHIKPWVGPFARFRLDTAAFAGTDIRSAPTNYVITRQDGTVDRTCDPDSGVPCATTKLPLTDAFQPLALKESIGVFAQPYKSNPITVEARVGLGGQEIFADKQFAVADVPDTVDNCPGPAGSVEKSAVACVEVNQLSDVLQAGLEANLEVWGTVYSDKISYKIYGGLLAPFAHGPLPKLYTDAGGRDDVGQLTNVDVGANVTFKIVEWASLTYEFKGVRVPALLPDTFQVRNTLLFTMGFGVDNKPPPPPAEKK